MKPKKQAPRRAIVVRGAGRTIRIGTDNCAWCTDVSVCSVCSARADAARAKLKEKA